MRSSPMGDSTPHKGLGMEAPSNRNPLGIMMSEPPLGREYSQFSITSHCRTVVTHRHRRFDKPHPLVSMGHGLKTGISCFFMGSDPAKWLLLMRYGFKKGVFFLGILGVSFPTSPPGPLSNIGEGENCLVGAEGDLGIIVWLGYCGSGLRGSFLCR